MKNLSRLFIALAIFLSGLALIPYINFSSEPFNWQMYADVYQPAPKMVDIQNFAFVPDLIIVQTGTTVRWTNQDDVPHTVTSDTGLFDSGTLQKGDSFEFTFDQPGTYGYHCSIHPTMTGTVIVVDQVVDIYLPLILR